MNDIININRAKKKNGQYYTEDKYILVDKKPVPEHHLLKWGQWFEEDDNRRVAEDIIHGILVSTVFLGLDHNFLGRAGHGYATPILFETMIFGGPHDEYQKRYCTWDEAIEGHKIAVASVKKAVALAEKRSFKNLFARISYWMRKKK